MNSGVRNGTDSSRKRRESQSQVSAEANKMPSRCVLFNLYYKEHVIVPPVRDCYSRDVVTFP
jgi:hypothetical protein